ncbi:calcium-binding EF-hand domain-containing protein [Dictyostelium discoideum AX4]|uniref:Calcium-binding EF-hand domain-containing protein n=1 Tax=Dictyostelium discoideum TaxID=44689 RepID=Q556Z1_DICDI|nr:calcium-binding EF-hand domain-containing protein [Dictyostelium discoideum AX4]XP_644772.1 calcium-binding EF-hand domain-containing protein [Dictyostelium discoideum AX4]EAL70552.1 calcium-binding EF-hand domain-containing protein [Dictyostelium discoideum AX4]EAL70820.1 calcium-binding EF-hand domain-containing protein [Dictyostelium discoideum AX4]|eukprot:XP_644478.1 calcium-binding EF-hand domain-containing protein [Dictyostelium discoideum AX4]
MYSTNSSSDDEEKELMDEIQLNQNLSGSFGGIGSSSNNIGASPGGDFINQMEQVFKTIDTEENGIISITQLRQEIESLTGESSETNPLIGKLLNFLRIVHRAEQPKNDDDEDENEDEQQEGDDQENTGGSDFEDDSSFEDLILNEKKQIEEDNTFVDLQSFLESMASYMDGEDPKKLREKQIEKLKLPKFKVPIDLLKKYNITPKFLSPLISGGNNSLNNNDSPNSGGGGSNMVFSHLNNSPSKSGGGGSSNKFNRLFTAKPMVTFEQFNQLITKLNYGKEIPKQKLLMHLHDLPTDKDDCIDANLFLSSFGGLNHPMSPKLTYNDDGEENLQQQRYNNEKKENQFNINSRGSGNTSPPNVKINNNNNTNSNSNTNINNTSTNNISQWNSKNTQIVDQLQDSYKILEKEVESYQSELSMLEKSRQIQDSTLKKKDQEIDKLRKEARFVDGMRDANKDLMVQNQNLKNQLSKLTLNEELLRESIDQEKDRLREAMESNVLKELELKKLKLLLKTQQNINNKLSMMVTFSDDTLQEGGGGGSGTNSPSGAGGSINFTSKRIKPTIDRAKQVLSRQKSDKFEIDKYSTIHANNNFSMFLKQQQLQLQEKQEKQYQQPYYYTSGTNSPQSLQSEFEELNKQQQGTTTPPLSQQNSINYDNNNNDNDNNDNDDGSSELDSLKKQLSGFDYQLPSEGSFDSPSHNQSFDSPTLLSSPPISQLISKVSDGPQPIQMMSPMTPPLPNQISSGNLSISLNATPSKEQSIKSLFSPNYIRTSSPSIKSTTTTTAPSSAPIYSSTPSTSTAAALLSPFSLNNPITTTTTTTTTTSNTVNSPLNNNNNNNNNTSSSSSTNIAGNSNSNSNSNSNLGYNTISSNSFNNIGGNGLTSSQLIQDQFNVGSIRRLKKSDIIRLHTSEMEEQNESAQMLITEAEKALEEFKKNSSLELQRLQKLLQEERQHSKTLEKQLSSQLDKNKEMVTGKESTNTSSWGGMQNFFSFVTNYLPSTLFCNLSSTS